MERKSLEPIIPDSVNYYRHQIEGIRELAKRKNFILADDMGLGKSLQAITVFAIDVHRGWAETALIICPVTLKNNWYDEFQKFTTIPATVLEGSPTQRSKMLDEFAATAGPRVLIVNYEQVAAHQIELESMDFHVTIFDEAHYLKNPKAKRTKACMALRTNRTFLLTGTPMLNQVNELWALLHLCNRRQFPKYYSFINRFCVFGGYQDRQIIGVKNEKQLTEHLQEYMIRRLKKDVLDLPEVQIIERKVDLRPEQRKLYDEVYNEMRLERVDKDEADDIENALTKFLRLKQICGTTFPFTGEDISSKLDLAVDDAIEMLSQGNKIVVFTQFRDVLERFCVRLDTKAPQYGIWELHGGIKQEERQPAVKDWAASTEPGALVCMLQVAGVGLNMTAARNALFLDKLFVPGLNQQAIDRLHRIGQSTTQPVQIFEYFCKGTIESRVNQILRNKKKIFGDIVESDPNWKRKLLQAMLEDDDE
jgi:SNF2 family DNA or RNA helicase